MLANQNETNTYLVSVGIPSTTFRAEGGDQRLLLTTFVAIS